MESLRERVSGEEARGGFMGLKPEILDQGKIDVAEIVKENEGSNIKVSNCSGDHLEALPPEVKFSPALFLFLSLRGHSLVMGSEGLTMAFAISRAFRTNPEEESNH